MKTVYFTGSLPHHGQPPVGGGEVGNLRTVRMLESFGYNVSVIRRLRSNAGDSKFKRILSYPLRFAWNIICLFFVLLLGKRKGNVVHISGFAGVTIFIETMQMGVAKMFGYKTIYELRGGGIVDFYDRGGGWYKKQFRFLVKKADYIFSQGRENEVLLKSICNTPVFYYPNCVQDGFYPKEMPDKRKDKICLLFFGRIEKEKNPMLIVQIASILQKRFDNINLTMIGNGQEEMLKAVRLAMEEYLTKDSFTLLPGCDHDELRKKIADKHFYVFPSEQPREGQSNAVTEAMSLGIIPIASPQGFNRSTIGEEYLIVDEMCAEIYAQRIASIIDDGKLDFYSKLVRERFLENYTENIVFEKAKAEYSKILG